MKIEVVLVGGVCSKRDSVDIASNGCCGKLGGLRRIEARRCDVMWWSGCPSVGVSIGRQRGLNITSNQKPGGLAAIGSSVACV